MSQSTTDNGREDMEVNATPSQYDAEVNAQRWPTPNDSEFACTQHSHVSNSQINKEDELANVEYRLEQMGYRPPLPCPVPDGFEFLFPLPRDMEDSKKVRGDLLLLKRRMDQHWESVRSMNGRGICLDFFVGDAQKATNSYMAFMEEIRNGTIKPVDAYTCRQEGNRLAHMRMNLLQMIAEESIKHPRKFDDEGKFTYFCSQHVSGSGAWHPF